jgi:lysophospholipase L1-like esterase
MTRSLDRSAIGPLRRAGRIGLLVAAAILASEASLRLLALASPQVRRVLAATGRPMSRLRESDALLGLRGNPAHPEHDAHGFRNGREPAGKPWLLALGDSLTYGMNAPYEGAWPRQLSALVHRPVYSMAFGGYGPAHSWLLWDEAMELAPQVVVLAVYDGNDLYDAASLVYSKDAAAALRSGSAEVRAAMSGAYKVKRRALSRRAQTRREARGAGGARGESDEADPEARNAPLFLVRSKLVGLLRGLRNGVMLEPVPEPAWDARTLDDSGWERRKRRAGGRDDVLVVDDAARRTILSPEYRLQALDLGLPRVREGLRITLEVIRDLHERALRRGVDFVVLMLPTKELVFAPDVPPDPTEPARRLLDDLVRNEEEVRAILEADLRSKGIAFLDALPALRAALASGPPPYSAEIDGHPNGEGYRAIAQLVAAGVSSPAPQD